MIILKWYQCSFSKQENKNFDEADDYKNYLKWVELVYQQMNYLAYKTTHQEDNFSFCSVIDEDDFIEECNNKTKQQYYQLKQIQSDCVDLLLSKYDDESNSNSDNESNSNSDNESNSNSDNESNSNSDNFLFNKKQILKILNQNLKENEYLDTMIKYIESPICSYHLLSNFYKQRNIDQEQLSQATNILKKAAPLLDETIKININNRIKTKEDNNTNKEDNNTNDLYIPKKVNIEQSLRNKFDNLLNHIKSIDIGFKNKLTEQINNGLQEQNQQTYSIEEIEALKNHCMAFCKYPGKVLYSGGETQENKGRMVVKAQYMSFYDKNLTIPDKFIQALILLSGCDCFGFLFPELKQMSKNLFSFPIYLREQQTQSSNDAEISQKIEKTYGLISKYMSKYDIQRIISKNNIFIPEVIEKNKEIQCKPNIQLAEILGIMYLYIQKSDIDSNFVDFWEYVIDELFFVFGLTNQDSQPEKEKDFFVQDQTQEDNSTFEKDSSKNQDSQPKTDFFVKSQTQKDNSTSEKDSSKNQDSQPKTDFFVKSQTQKDNSTSEKDSSKNQDSQPKTDFFVKSQTQKDNSASEKDSSKNQDSQPKTDFFVKSQTQEDNSTFEKDSSKNQDSQPKTDFFAQGQTQKDNNKTQKNGNRVFKITLFTGITFTAITTN